MASDRKNATQPDVDISALRMASSAGGTPRFWRGLDELADTPEFRNHKENEFPHGANDPNATLDRRDLLTVMAASAAFAGLSDETKGRVVWRENRRYIDIKRQKIPDRIRVLRPVESMK